MPRTPIPIDMGKKAHEQIGDNSSDVRAVDLTRGLIRIAFEQGRGARNRLTAQGFCAFPARSDAGQMLVTERARARPRRRGHERQRGPLWKRRRAP